MRFINILMIILFVLIPKIRSQQPYDTLYLYHDTTIFNNETVFLSESISNIALKFQSDYDWNGYVISKIFFQLYSDSSQIAYGPLRVSSGSIPEEYILLDTLITESASFPAWQTVVLAQPLSLNDVEHFYISGDLLTNIVISSFSAEPILNHFHYKWASNQWIEGSAHYFAVKVVIEKPVSVGTDNSESKVGIAMYPNPFNPSTTIKYSLSTSEKVILKVYDILGREIAELVNDFKTAGEYTVTFDGNGLASGVYLYNITAGSFSEMRKMLLLR